jgi:hypothetical protein
MKPPEESLSSSGGFFIKGIAIAEGCISDSFLPTQGVENENLKVAGETLEIKVHIQNSH